MEAVASQADIRRAEKRLVIGTNLLIIAVLAVIAWVLLAGCAWADAPRVSGCGFGDFPPCIITESKPAPIEVIIVPSTLVQPSDYAGVNCLATLRAAMAAMHVWIYRKGKQPTIPRPEYYYTETLPLWDKARRECGKEKAQP